MTITIWPDALATTPARARLRWPRVTEARVVFGAAFMINLAAALVLVYVFDAVDGDALARVANGYYVTSSRDPHLGAVGFVWGPLPSLVMLPMLPLKGILPDLVALGLAANIVSAFFMAAATAQLVGIARDAGLPTRARLVLAATFVLHPMVLMHAANGLSEALLLYLLVSAIHRLSRWTRSANPLDLAAVGLALALAYLTRYESLAAVIGATGFVAICSFIRSSGSSQSRRRVAVADALIVALPAIATVAVYALISEALTGRAFEYLTSEYGAKAFVADQRDQFNGSIRVDGLAGAVRYNAAHWLGLAPMLLIAPLLMRRAARRIELLAPVAVAGAISGFVALATVTGRLNGTLRYSMTVIPFGFALVGMLRQLGSRRWPALSVAFLTVPALATSFLVMRNDHLSWYEAPRLDAIVRKATGGPTTAPLGTTASWRKTAAALDRLPVGRGQILTDTFKTFGVVVAVHEPERLVITSDRDFASAVADPAGAGVRFILVSASPTDALNRAYPDFFHTGGGIARLVEEFDGPDRAGRLRLFEVVTTGGPRQPPVRRS